MSSVTGYLDIMCNESLRQCASEILSWHATGILVDGSVRLYGRKLVEIFDIDPTRSLYIVEDYVCERCMKNYLMGEA